MLWDMVYMFSHRNVIAQQSIQITVDLPEVLTVIWLLLSF